LIRSGGSLVTAADLINRSRVSRGQLAPATAADGAPTLLGYIDYERDIELLNTNGWTLMQRRHIDGLQSGTVHHLPIPASELETLVLPIYTFGGAGKEQSIGGLGFGTMSRSLLPSGNVRQVALPDGQLVDLHYPAEARTGRARRQ
jgi:hypothetical protein